MCFHTLSVKEDKAEARDADDVVNSIGKNAMRW
jgi:hypothetical protein